MKSKKTPQPEPKRAAIYVRVSTEDQANDGYGLDVQLERCNAQIVAKGWANAGVYQDAGISGVKGEADRPGMAALLDAAKRGEFQAVVFLALDRLGRKARLVFELVDKLTGMGIDLVSCKESLDTSTPQGRFVLQMFASLAELEWANTRERTIAGRNERGRQDGERGGRVPMGYVRDESGAIQVDSGRAAIVRQMFAMRRQGETLQAIAAYLNTQGITTMRGKQWQHTSVREVLGNEDMYRGGQRWQSSVKWPVILEDE